MRWQNRIDVLEHHRKVICRKACAQRQKCSKLGSFRLIVVPLVFVAACGLVCVPGCSPPPGEPAAAARPFVQNLKDENEEGYLLVLALDLSGSFYDLMTKDGKAYEFALSVMDRYFRDRIGTADEVIITQLSGNAKPMIWAGTPIQLRADFEDAEAFKKFLTKRADPGGSRLLDGLSDTIEYVLEQPGVIKRKKKICFLALTDMEDNVNTTRSLPRFKRDLNLLAEAKAACGFYWVTQTLVHDLKTNLSDAGFTHCVVEPDFKTNPTLPTFED